MSGLSWRPCLDGGTAGSIAIPSSGTRCSPCTLLVFSLSTLRDPSAAEVAFSLLLSAPLVLRRRAPVATFAVVMVICAAQLVFVDRFLAANVAALVALYTLVAYAPRRLATIGCGVALAGTVPMVARVDDFTSDSWFVTWLVLAVHLAFAAVLGDRRRAQLLARERLAEDAAAAERERIARELHDVVAHSLSVVIAQADGGRYAQEPGAAQAALRTISATAREALREMRHALGTVHDAPLQPQPGAGELPGLVARTREAGLPVELAEEGSPRPLAPAAGLTIYRVAQEALTNVLKHAGPGATATVLLRWEPERVTLVVRDDGAGPGAGDGRGRGLAGMRERLEPRGGTLVAGPRPEGGFEVRAAIPARS